MLLAAVILAVAFVAIGVPLALRRVPPNGVYGVRVPATLADPAVWYEVNARFGRRLIYLATWLPAVALALRELEPRLGAETVELVFFLQLMLGTVGLGLWEWRVANRLLAQRRAGLWPSDGPAA